MIWLAGQLWPLLLLSAVLGALCVAIWGQRRVAVEVWEEVPVPPAREPEPETEPETEEADAAPPASVTAPVPVDADDPTSPFPVAAAGEPAPWEEEELWSRPARVGATGQARRPKDEWAEAAENWRSWADEATGRGFSGAALEDGALAPNDRDLFAADREVARPGPSESAAGEESGPERGPQPGATDEETFPYARPVEAPRGAEGTMDPMDDPDMDEMDDDEREAAEIRRMREQERRGDVE